MVNADIPKEWVVKTIAQLGNYNPATVQTGPFGAQLHSSDYVDEGVPFILIKNLQDGGLDTTDMPHITYQDAHRLSLYALQTGDVVFSRVGRVGSCFLVEKEQEGWMISGQMLRIRLPSDAIDRHYLIHALRSKPAQDRITGVSVGSTRQSINTQILESLKVLVPSFPEQRRIAEILDAADDAIRQTEHVIAKLRKVKAGLLHDLLTRGLDAKGRLRDPDAHPEQFKESPLGRIPREWEVTTLGEVITKGGGLIQTGPFGSQLHAYEYTKEGVPVIMPQDMKDSHVSLEQIARISKRRAEDLARHRVQINDVVFARRGDLSRCVAIGERELGWVCGTGCLLIRPSEKVINGDWLAAIYQHDACQRQIAAKAVGSTMVNLNTALLESLLIAMPSYQEQCCVMETYNAADARIRAEEATLAKLRQVKRGLMDDLLTGRVRV